MTANKQYLGDGAYVEYDGYCIWITAEDGTRVTDRVCLELEVFANLLRFTKEIGWYEPEPRTEP